MAKWKASVVCCMCMLLAAGAASGATKGKMKARADLKDVSGKSVGTATFVEQKHGVQLKLKVSGLPAGNHGFHVHETGTCTPPDFKSAGPHFNPFEKQHGSDNPKGKHLGDMPNLEVKQDGKAQITVVLEGATLKKGPASLLKEGGTALVIHADPDDYLTDPAGNAGDRIACGVIMKEK